MITFKDTEGNTVHVRPDAILCVLTKSPLTTASKTENVVLIQGGVSSPVRHETAMEVLEKIEEYEGSLAFSGVSH